MFVGARPIGAYIQAAREKVIDCMYGSDQHPEQKSWAIESGQWRYDAASLDTEKRDNTGPLTRV